MEDMSRIILPKTCKFCKKHLVSKPPYICDDCSNHSTGEEVSRANNPSHKKNFDPLDKRFVLAVGCCVFLLSTSSGKDAGLALILAFLLSPVYALAVWLFSVIFTMVATSSFQYAKDISLQKGQKKFVANIWGVIFAIFMISIISIWAI